IVRNYRFATHQLSEPMIGRLRDITKIGPRFPLQLAEEYDEMGRFSESGAALAEVAAFEDATYKDAYPLYVQGRAAISLGLAGNLANADDLYKKTKAQAAQLTTDVKKVPDEEAVVELLDFYCVC